MTKLLGSGCIKRSPVLDIHDHRTGRRYSLPIVRNTIQAVDFKQVVAHTHSSGLTEEGLLVVDEGFRNTAPIYSPISRLYETKPILKTLPLNETILLLTKALGILIMGLCNIGNT